MSKVISEYFGEVTSSDAFDDTFGRKIDFLKNNYKDKSYDWVITNPPFNLAEEFIIESFRVARVGVAMLTRTVFIESIGRYKNLFESNPPDKFAQFCERVPMVKGRLDKKASTATGYAWITWDLQAGSGPKLAWIPPCRKRLERPGDYNNGKNDEQIIGGEELPPVAASLFDQKY